MRTFIFLRLLCQKLIKKNTKLFHKQEKQTKRNHDKYSRRHPGVHLEDVLQYTRVEGLCARGQACFKQEHALP